MLFLVFFLIFVFHLIFLIFFFFLWNFLIFIIFLFYKKANLLSVQNGVSTPINRDLSSTCRSKNWDITGPWWFMTVWNSWKGYHQNHCTRRVRRSWPFVAWGIDIVGPFEKATAREYKYILVANCLKARRYTSCMISIDLKGIIPHDTIYRPTGWQKPLTRLFVLYLKRWWTKIRRRGRRSCHKLCRPTEPQLG